MIYRYTKNSLKNESYQKCSEKMDSNWFLDRAIYVFIRFVVRVARVSSSYWLVLLCAVEINIQIRTEMTSLSMRLVSWSSYTKMKTLFTWTRRFSTFQIHFYCFPLFNVQWTDSFVSLPDYLCPMIRALERIRRRRRHPTCFWIPKNFNLDFWTWDGRKNLLKNNKIRCSLPSPKTFCTRRNTCSLFAFESTSPHVRLTASHFWWN